MGRGIDSPPGVPRRPRSAKCGVKVCPKCSGVKKKHLKAGLAKGDYARGCFGACRKKHPEFEGKVYARIDGELVACDSSKKLVKKMAAAIA